MALHNTASALLVLTLLLGGCGMFSTSAPPPPAAPEAMPLTEANVDAVRSAVAKAKSQTSRPAAPGDYEAYVRRVYVAPWTGHWSAAATTEAALAQAGHGSALARQYLAIMVYDVQLLSVMEGASLSTGQWRDVYVRSGVMSENAYSGYVAMNQGRRALP